MPVFFTKLKESCEWRKRSLIAKTSKQESGMPLIPTGCVSSLFYCSYNYRTVAVGSHPKSIYWQRCGFGAKWTKTFWGSKKSSQSGALWISYEENHKRSLHFYITGVFFGGAVLEAAIPAAPPRQASANVEGPVVIADSDVSAERAKSTPQLKTVQRVRNEFPETWIWTETNARYKNKIFSNKLEFTLNLRALTSRTLLFGDF